ncbi:hypothetical protein QE152_g13718 [Popillia japonica]|uniref:Uncharacterized protein n=1 Tax=Popillia japonica TaxID=7064 RepID=A0AAW1LBU6_POPJA
MPRRVREWRVLQTENLTDHAYIMFDISNKTGYTSTPSTVKESFLCDWNGFSEELTLRISGISHVENLSYTQCTTAIRSAYRNDTHTKDAPHGPSISKQRDVRVRRITTMELEQAADSMKNTRAPGLNGVPPKAIGETGGYGTGASSGFHEKY